MASLCAGVREVLSEQVTVQIAKRSKLHAFKVLPKRWWWSAALLGWTRIAGIEELRALAHQPRSSSTWHLGVAAQEDREHVLTGFDVPNGTDGGTGLAQAGFVFARGGARGSFPDGIAVIDPPGNPPRPAENRRLIQDRSSTIHGVAPVCQASNQTARRLTDTSDFE